MPGEQIAITGLQTGADIAMQGWQNRMNKQSAHEALRNNLVMWDIMNKYNSPKEQMKRYREAGLNPNLIYGQGSPGNATQLPKYMGPEYKMQLPDVMGMLGQYHATKNMQQQTLLTNTEQAGKIIENQIRDMEASRMQQVRHWETQRRYVDSTGKEISNLHEHLKAQKNMDMEIAGLKNAQKELTKEMVSKAKTFNKYMDQSQVAGIINKYLPLLQLLNYLK